MQNESVHDIELRSSEGTKPPLQAIAFYLPQFHVIPENEAIYGKGFTEWDNVRRAKPLFPGHYQPHVPHKTIGYYNLLDEKFIERQHAIAFENGVKGFCYYYYNMAGRPLLEKPLHIINGNRNIKNDFCLCWAHPSWYNNTDPGKPIFLAQQYSADNARKIFADLMKYFENPRYISIDGKPLLSVFASERNPMMREYADIWREEAIKHGLPGVWLAGIEAYVGCHPDFFGFDSMIEFAPQWHDGALVSAPDAKPRQMDYLEVLRFMLGHDAPDYLLNRCAFPSWDNIARRGSDGICATGISVDIYKTYLDCICEYTRDNLPENLQYIFINAWNEWGEGAHLEPDQRYGYQWLTATRQVMKKYQ